MIPVPYPATIICIKAPTKKLTPNVLDNAGNTENPFFKSFSIELAKSSFDLLVPLESLLMCGSCHIRSVLIGIDYYYFCRIWDVYLLFTILLGQIKSKLN